ncbi:MAG: hypothetical protein J0H43_04190 [Actinobacteria bacterium]|nr:hypothetical protein [Actinomycetota bacterium]
MVGWSGLGATATWRVRLKVRLVRLDQQALGVTDAAAKQLVTGYLAEARQGVESTSPQYVWSGYDIERSWQNVHAAEVALLRAVSLDQATASLPSLVEDCKAVLPDDPRLKTLTAAVGRATPLTAAEQTLLADTLLSAYETSDAQHVRVRSFRNILIATTVMLTLLAAVVAIVAAVAPSGFAVCDVTTTGAPSCPGGAHHPTGPDVILVELLGLVGAAITGAASVRKLSGTSTPYAVPLASLILKLPTGALTALLGLLLIRAGFASTITATTQAQVAAWAVVFGAAQQLFMQFVDKQAKSVLDGVTTPGDKSKPSSKAGT